MLVEYRLQFLSDSALTKIGQFDIDSDKSLHRQNHLSDAGVPLRHIQEISGHRTLAALERYLGVTDEQKENAMVAKRTALCIATLDL